MHTEGKQCLGAWAALAALVSGLHCASHTGAGAASPVAVAAPRNEPARPWLDAAPPPPPAAPRLTQVRDYLLAAGGTFDDTLRGDWDTSSALLVVYNATWRRPLERLLEYAHSDLPVYVLATPEDTKSRQFKHWLRKVPFAGVVSIELDTPWIRDYGPLEVQRSRGISWIDMIYAPDDRPFDDAVPTLLG